MITVKVCEEESSRRVRSKQNHISPVGPPTPEKLLSHRSNFLGVLGRPDFALPDTLQCPVTALKSLSILRVFTRLGHDRGGGDKIFAKSPESQQQTRGRPWSAAARGGPHPRSLACYATETQLLGALHKRRQTRIKEPRSKPKGRQEQVEWGCVGVGAECQSDSLNYPLEQLLVDDCVELSWARQETGIQLFNPDIFDDYSFALAGTTNVGLTKADEKDKARATNENLKDKTTQENFQTHQNGVKNNKANSNNSDDTSQEGESITSIEEDIKEIAVQTHATKNVKFDDLFPISFVSNKEKKKDRNKIHMEVVKNAKRQIFKKFPGQSRKEIVYAEDSENEDEKENLITHGECADVSSRAKIFVCDVTYIEPKIALRVCPEVSSGFVSSPTDFGSYFQTRSETWLRSFRELTEV
ncbi:hypothetical protein ILUMI_25408 [Ignelater luminosus]|uniref:Uncharacterized protein n=1 Tax=Ignelater luminosus TaxID=2038154 RepID=A0A8K0CBT3_IGNLU|nr:hypothetical protein ILUMI_25408 [Ignelater luminosus]